jgi:Xaa-Pro dipeptidase
MVLCIEPSIRVPGWGGCSIEQEVVVTRQGCELLTDFPARLW